jgi:hypothetical protein
MVAFARVLAKAAQIAIAVAAHNNLARIGTPPLLKLLTCSDKRVPGMAGNRKKLTNVPVCFWTLQNSTHGSHASCAVAYALILHLAEITMDDVTACIERARECAEKGKTYDRRA